MCLFFHNPAVLESGLDDKPGGPSNNTALGLLDSNLHLVPRAMPSYTSGLCKASNIVSSISLNVEIKFESAI